MSSKDSSLLWQHTDQNDLASFKSSSEDLIGKEGEPMRSLTFLSDANPIRYFEENELHDYEVSIEKSEGFWRINLTRTIKHNSYKDGYRDLTGEFILFKNEPKGVWTAITRSDADFFEKGLASYIKVFRPDISLPYLSTEDMRRIFEALDNEIDGKIYADRTIIYSHQDEAEMSYETMEFQEAFNKASDSDRYIDKMNFFVKGPTGNKIEGFIGRNGQTRFESGSADIYYDKFLLGVSKRISSKGNLFGDKSRQKGSNEAKSLEIKFDEGTIRDTEDNDEVIEALDSIKKSSVVVYHDNPYLHASVMNYQDGTSADVFITGDNTISIVPSYRATKDGLMKICDMITQKFNEGEVEKQSESSRDFDDYFE